jgi:hypothetical protein
MNTTTRHSVSLGEFDITVYIIAISVDGLIRFLKALPQCPVPSLFSLSPVDNPSLFLITESFRDLMTTDINC